MSPDEVHRTIRVAPRDRRPSLAAPVVALVAFASIAVAPPAARLARAEGPAGAKSAPAVVAAPTAGTALSPAPAAGAAPSDAAAPTASAAPKPTDATSALDRVRAAYEYGDIDEVIEWARPVAEGRFEATPPQRAFALRYLGIGLFLVGRAAGAETAFFELLRARPETRLDSKTTRPDVVAFFEQVRARHAKEITQATRGDNSKHFILNLLPPGGQLQNGHRGRAVVIGSLELVSFASSLTSLLLLRGWEQPHHEFTGHYAEANAMKAINWASAGVFAATYAYGVIDGLINYGQRADEPSDEAHPPVASRYTLTPAGFALTF